MFDMDNYDKKVYLVIALSFLCFVLSAAYSEHRKQERIKDAVSSISVMIDRYCRGKI